MKNDPASRWLLPLLLAGAFLLTVATGGRGYLFNETDCQYAGAAKVMAEGGSWLIPENNGIPRLVKPPLLYWAMTASIAVFGENEFAIRLPGALSLCALVWITYLIGERMGGRWRGFMAGAILLTSLGTFTLGRIVMPEPTFCALIAGGIYCVLRGMDAPAQRRWWFLGFWLCAALASFTKGVHGLLYPLIIIALTALFHRAERKDLRGLLSWQGGLLFLAINLPWYFYVESRYPGYLHNLFFAEQLGHMTGAGTPATNHSDVPRVQFLLLHLAWFFPWAIPGLAALFASRRQISRPLSFQTRLVVLWVGVVFLSAMLTGQRQDYYAMAGWPAVALVMAACFERTIPRWSRIVVAALLGAGFVAALFRPSLTANTETAPLAERATAWSTLVSFDASVWSSLSLTALLTLGGAFAAAALACFLPQRKAFLSLTATGACLALGAINGTAIVSPYFSAGPLEEFFAATPAGAIVFDGDIDTGSSLLFYADRPVLLLDQKAEKDFIVRKFGVGRDRYLTSEELVQRWREAAPLLLVTEKSRLTEWRSRFGQPDLAPAGEAGTQIVLKNHP